MEKTRKPESTNSLNELVTTIHDSLSGTVLADTTAELRQLIDAHAESRVLLFSDKALLTRLLASCATRRRKLLSAASKKRFDAADALLLSTLSEWDRLYSPTFPVLHGWVTYQRGIGTPIPDEQQDRDDAMRRRAIDLFKLQEELSRVTASIKSELAELSQLIEMFTPSIEEAFSDLVTDVTEGGSSGWTLHNQTVGVDVTLQEVDGVNDELYRSAREKFNYVSKKLVPKLTRLVEEAESIDNTSAMARNARSELHRITHSPAYLNFVVLLSKHQSTRPTGSAPPRKKAKDDREYDSWF